MTKKKQNIEKAKQIKVIATDVDGVLTDGFLFIDEKENEPLAKFSILDGLGIKMAHDCGLKIIVISGRKSLCTEARCRKLGVDEVYTGVNNKRAKLSQIAKKLKLDFAEIAYIGDDLIDLGVMQLVALKVAPKNAVKVVKQHVDFVTKAKGGEGALRELIEYILCAQNKYTDYVSTYIN